MSKYTLPLKRRLAILERDGWKCVYCGQPLTYDMVPARGPEGCFTSPPGYQYPTMDHVIPRSKGGGHDMDNVVAACHRCNSKKYTKDVDLFREGLK